MKFRQKQKLALAITFAGLALLAVPMHFVRAYGITDITGNVVQFFMGQIFLLLEGCTAILAKGLTLAVVVRAGGNVPVVSTTWKILRDFSNMFFIVLLIWMAFATIFDVGNYKFTSMIGNFVMVAVLINFSLAIGNLVIDACQVLSNVFLASIGDLGARLGAYLNPTLLFPSNISTVGWTTASGVSALFAIILALIFLFSITVALIFAIIRVPFIWGLLIISPFAWMSFIMPNSKRFWSWWWSQFIGWNLFLPVYLFFMYLGLLFLAQRNAIIAQVIQSGSGPNPASLPLFNITGGVTFNLLFFYIFAAVIMVGAVTAAKYVTSMFGGGFEKGLGWATEAAHNIKGFSQIRPMRAAFDARRAQIKEEGLPGVPGLRSIVRGQQGLKSDTEYYKQKFGVRASQEGNVPMNVSSAKSRFQSMDTAQLRARFNSGNDYEKLAVRELLKERNQLTNAEQVETFNMYAKENEQLATKFGNSINFGQLSPLEREQWLDRTNDTELRKKIVNAMADKGDFNTASEVIDASTHFSSETDRANFMKKAAKRLSGNEVSQILTTLGTTATREERSALSEVLNEKGELDGAQILATYRELGAGSEDGEKFINKIKFDSLDRTDRDTMYQAARRGELPDVEVQHKLYESLIEKEEFDGTKLRQMVDTYRTSDEKKELLKKAQKKDFITATRVRFAAGLSGSPTTPVTTIQEAIQEQVDRMPAPDLADLPAGVKGWGDPMFKAAVVDRMNYVQLHQPPVPARPMNPALPVGPTNPMIPGKPGGGSKLKQDLLEAIKGNRRKVADINSLPNLP